MKYFDHKGNEIKSGMVLNLISTKNKIVSLFGMKPNSNEKLNEVHLPKDEWRIIFECSVFEKDGLLWTESKYGECSVIKRLDSFIDGNSSDLSEGYIIAIKGLSDTSNLK